MVRSTCASIALLAFTACTPARPVVVLPPADLTTCAAEPQAPDLPARDGTEATQRQRDVTTLDYILSLVSAGGDCRSKVAGLNAWREKME